MVRDQLSEEDRVMDESKVMDEEKIVSEQPSPKQQRKELEEKVVVEKLPSKYPREEFMANAEAIFGVKPEVVAGALYGQVQDEFTVDEMRKLIEQFLKRRVI